MQVLQVKKIMESSSDHKRHAHDEQYNTGAVFASGEYCSILKPVIPIYEQGFLQSDAIYDVVSATRGYIFRLSDHLKRFEQNCSKFSLKNPYSCQETEDILNNLVKLTGFRDAYIFWCVTRGLPKGNGPVDRKDFLAFENQFYAYVVDYGFICDDAQRTAGADIMVSKKYKRIPPSSVDPTAKNFHWMDMKLALFEANGKGYDWTILLDAQGNLTESPGANIFIVKDNIVYTPESGCLEGITRRTAVELCNELNIPVKITNVPVEMLLDADEAFMTSTAGGIMPVNSVDHVLLGGTSGPGVISSRLHNLYWEKRWAGWLGTPVDYSAALAV